jgi:hypothetical protein
MTASLCHTDASPDLIWRGQSCKYKYEKGFMGRVRRMPSKSIVYKTKKHL